MNEMLWIPDLNILVKLQHDRFGTYVVIPHGKGNGQVPEQKNIYSLNIKEA
jgi:topoisomerase IA-like protein